MCTRMFWSSNRQAKVCSRTMDWEVSDEPELWVFPPGLTRTCSGIGDNARTWTSRYGSVALSAWGSAVSDGLNERGLAAHVLYLDRAQYEARDQRPAISNLLWVQYVLDNFATVAEALASMEQVQVASALIRDRHFGLHLAIEDAEGDAAVIEYVAGQLVVHHGPSCTVLANDPTYDEQLANLTRYRPFGGELPPPRDILSLHRFVRAAYFLHYLPEPGTYAEAVAGVMGVARNVAVPAGAPYDDFSVYPTWWISTADVTNRVYYFESLQSPSVVWIDLSRLDLSEGAPVQRLNPRDPALAGDVAGNFAPADQPF